jgi:hypothetical protein
MVGRSSRPSGVVPPNQRIQPTPLRGERDRADFLCYYDVKAVPTYRCGAADAPGVRRLRPKRQKQHKCSMKSHLNYIV